jgi:hypothetical protein
MMSRARTIFDGSNGEATKAYYVALEALGPAGVVAMNLFRAQKASTRPRFYTRRYSDDAYRKKEWSLGLCVDALLAHGAALGITFGWKVDPLVPLNGAPSWVLYVDLPEGQVSFHCPSRGKGPDYPGEWDGQRGASEGRIVRHCDRVMGDA